MRLSSRSPHLLKKLIWSPPHWRAKRTQTP